MMEDNATARPAYKNWSDDNGIKYEKCMVYWVSIENEIADFKSAVLIKIFVPDFGDTWFYSNIELPSVVHNMSSFDIYFSPKEYAYRMNKLEQQ